MNPSCRAKRLALQWDGGCCELIFGPKKRFPGVNQDTSQDARPAAARFAFFGEASLGFAHWVPVLTLELLPINRSQFLC